jgi:tyrosinase
MNVDIQVNNSASLTARYLTWAWSPCRVRVTNPTGITGPTASVQLSQAALGGAGSIRFSATPTGAGAATLTVNVAAGGASTPFFVRGLTASNADPGVRILTRWRPTPAAALTQVGSVDLMVRIRKSAISLNTGERTRLINAFAQLNNQGMGRFADFRAAHVFESQDEAHGFPAFLPWHRAYILDLERELQIIEPSVALPYWRCDQAAAALFTPSYFGRGNNTSSVILDPGHPFLFWKTDNDVGIVRQPGFNINGVSPQVLSQALTLALGPSFAQFRTLESKFPNPDPHGMAHTSFAGPIRAIRTAAKDPLFFLLHCNVDRLWAVWQRQNGRYNIADGDTYQPAPLAGHRIGHNLGDTMWPWNGNVTFPRPSSPPPGGTMAPSPCVEKPGLQPQVQQCFDYQGTINIANNLGFSYDDVPL